LENSISSGDRYRGYDAALKAEVAPAPSVSPTSGTDWMNDWMKSAFGIGKDGQQVATDQVAAPTFDAEKARLDAARTSRLQALDATYASDLATVQKNNKNVGNSLKARLMKLGVKPTDSAWSNAEAGQLERDTAAETKLRNEYMSNKAKIEADLDDKITTLAMNEAKMSFDATVKNIENKLQTQAQGINLYQIFSNRDQSEKDREQRAYASMLDYEGKMATLDQAQQEAISKNFIDNAQKGLYNVSDKATLEMLAKLEKESPYLTGLTKIATAGLSDRLDKKAQDAANLAKIKADTAQSYASINKMRSDAKVAGDKEKAAFYDDAEKQLNLLASGKTDWATAYNTMAAKYEAAPGKEKEMATMIDTVLNKAVWSQPNAYGQIQADRAKVDPNTILLQNISGKLNQQ